MVSHNEGIPSETTGCLWFRMLESDIPCFHTRTGLPPTPVRFAFPDTGTVFVIAFIYVIQYDHIISPHFLTCQAILFRKTDSIL